MKIYLASSWRNEDQPYMVDRLRAEGHEVYDFRNPPRSTGFQWSHIDPNWRSWTAAEYRKALQHRVAFLGYEADMGGMKWADACVLLLPCGRSAHLEAGWFAGKGKLLFILTKDGEEPELMAKMATEICIHPEELIFALKRHEIVKRG